MSTLNNNCNNITSRQYQINCHNNINNKKKSNNNNIKNNFNSNFIKMQLNSNNIQKTTTCLNKACIDYAVQMEHSYSRDCRPIEGINGLTTRTLMVHKPPQCPSCHLYPLDESLDLDEINSSIPPYDEIAARDSMNETCKIAQSVRNVNADDEIWENRVSKIGWTPAQENLFTKIAHALDLDNLSRLATISKQHEPVHRRVTIDRSANRFRQIFASISWDIKLTQWLHGILMEYLPYTYMAIYLDVLQTLKTKLPTLMDKMLFGKPMNINQELLTPVMKKQWEPIVPQKQRKLPGNVIILILPSTSYNSGGMSSRMQKWCQLFSTLGQIVQVQIPNANSLNKQKIDYVCENLVHHSRVKIQELRRDNPSSHIILVGFNASASLALQVSLTENVNSIICLGFAYNTINGVRGTPDDQMLDIKIPIMFVIGQNSARTSQEEMESLREKMHSETSLVVIGSADDVLRVPKSKRQIEGVTQSMVDSMIMDEIYEFARKCILNPPGPRQVTTITTLPVQVGLSQAKKTYTGANTFTNINNLSSTAGNNNLFVRKHKLNQPSDSDIPQKMKYTKRPKKLKYQDPFQVKRKVGRPRIRPLPNTMSSSSNIVQSNNKSRNLISSQPSDEVLSMAIQSILPSNDSSSINDDQQLQQKQQQQALKGDDNDEDDQIFNALELLTQTSPSPHQIKSAPISPSIVESTTNATTSGSNVLTTIQFQPQQSRNTILTTTQSTTSTPTPLQPAQKIKMIPTNKFIHVKPPSQQNAQKIYTIKTSPMLGTANNQSQIFTVKTAGSQLTPSSSGGGNSSNTIVLNSPPKFTVFKAGANIISALQSAQTTAAATATLTTDNNEKLASSTADLSSTNILDLPILFADNDGNIQDTVSSQLTTQNSLSTTAVTANSSSTSSPIILNHQLALSSQLPPPQSSSSSVTSQNPTGILSQSTSGKLILNTTAASSLMQNKGKPNKVVYINRNTMKSMGANIISAKNMPPLKYTKVVVTNPKTAAPSIVPKAIGGQQIHTDTEKGITTIRIQKPSSITSAGGILKAAASSSSTTGTIIGQTGQITSGKKFQPIIINVDSDKTTIKNMIRVSGTASDPSQMKPTILLKPSDLKPLPVSALKPGILNRNLTVRKVVNILQAKPNTAVAAASLPQITTVSSSPSPAVAVAAVTTGSSNTTVITTETNATTSSSSSVAVEKNESESVLTTSNDDDSQNIIEIQQQSEDE